MTTSGASRADSPSAQASCRSWRSAVETTTAHDERRVPASESVKTEDTSGAASRLPPPYSPTRSPPRLPLRIHSPQRGRVVHPRDETDYDIPTAAEREHGRGGTCASPRELLLAAPRSVALGDDQVALAH